MNPVDNSSSIRFVELDNSWNSRRLQEAFAGIGREVPEVVVDTFSVGLRNQLLVTGRYVAAVPASTLPADNPDGRLKVLPVEFPDKPWPVAMVTLKDRMLTPAAQQFVESARASAKALERRGKGKSG